MKSDLISTGMDVVPADKDAMQPKGQDREPKPSTESTPSPGEKKHEPLEHEFACTAAREELIEECLLGRLDRESTRELMDHFFICERCRIHFDEMKGLLG